MSETDRDFWKQCALAFLVMFVSWILPILLVYLGLQLETDGHPNLGRVLVLISGIYLIVTIAWAAYSYIKGLVTTCDEPDNTDASVSLNRQFLDHMVGIGLPVLVLCSGVYLVTSDHLAIGIALTACAGLYLVLKLLQVTLICCSSSIARGWYAGIAAGQNKQRVSAIAPEETNAGDESDTTFDDDFDELDDEPIDVPTDQVSEIAPHDNRDNAETNRQAGDSTNADDKPTEDRGDILEEISNQHFAKLVRLGLSASEIYEELARLILVYFKSLDLPPEKAKVCLQASYKKYKLFHNLGTSTES